MRLETEPLRLERDGAAAGDGPVVDPAADYPADNWLQRPDLPLRGFRG